MTNNTVAVLPETPWQMHVQERGDAAGWLALGGTIVDTEPPIAALRTRAPALSTEAAALTTGLKLPIAAWASLRGHDEPALRSYVRGLNDLIVGPDASSPTIALLRSHASEPDALDLSRLRLKFRALWNVPELAVLERLRPADIEDEWRRRLSERLPEAAGVIRDDQRCATFWRDMPGGDFDVQGRGLDYTEGMRAFPACRAIGVQSLLTLLGAFDPGPRVYLDVLGGEGYVCRLMEANRCLARRQLLVLPSSGLVHANPSGGVSSTALETLIRAAQVNRDAVVMLAAGAAADRDRPQPQARLLGLAGDRVLVSEPFAFSVSDLVQWLDGRTPAARDGDGSSPVSRALRPFLDARNGAGAPVMITNDVSRHMFYRAGLWGTSTREDARRLSRTFRANGLDGVLCAYGTHHIEDIYAALQQSHLILKPEGCIVVHDFFDNGPVGRWFHDIVHRYSKTGHPMPHIGPIEMAVCLYRAGFREVELFEIEDSFVFTAAPEDGQSARDVALRYTMGMYGMSAHFARAFDELEALISATLVYPELGEAPVFGDEFTLIPRRAIVARARKPPAGEPQPFSARDRALIQAMCTAFETPRAAMLRRTDVPAAMAHSWLGAGGARWGVSSRKQRAWAVWARAQRAAGLLP
jgi:SAM-dependent methyltransferase